MLYRDGLGVQKDPDQAFHYAKLAADQRHSSGYVLLGDFYAEGKGIEKSIEESVRYYQMAAELENIAAFYRLADAYENGIGVEKSEEKASFFRRKIFEYYREKADKGDPESQAIVGRLYEKGIGVQNNPNLAVQYYKLAIEQGSGLSLEDLGRCYEKGIGVPRDQKLAVQYYKRSSDQGCGYGSASFARFYERYNLALAIEYYKKAVDQGNNLCLKCLGRCYEELNPALAIEYYKKAIDQGDDLCLEDLGRCYEKGIGIKPNPTLASQYYKRSSDCGWSPGSKSLAHCYEKGVGVNFSPALAIQYYRLAIEQGNDEAFRHIRLRLNELPDGLHAVYLHTPEITEGKYPSICISFTCDLKNKKEYEIINLFSFEVFGVLHIIDRKIQSLSITKNMIDYLEKFNIKEMYLVIDGEIRVIDHPIKLIALSSQTYQNFCSQISTTLKKLHIL